MIVAVIILGLLCLGLAGFVFWTLSRPRKSDGDAALLLKADMTQLAKGMTDLKDGLQKQFTEQMGTSNKQMAAQLGQRRHNGSDPKLSILGFQNAR